MNGQEVNQAKLVKPLITIMGINSAQSKLGSMFCGRIVSDPNTNSILHYTETQNESN